MKNGTDPVGEPTLLLGTAKVDITPEYPVFLGGYGHRKTLFEGISHPLHAKVALLRQHQGNQMKQQLIISGDLLGWGNDVTHHIRTQLQAYGFATDEIMLSASHTHSGPQIDERLALIGAVDQAYKDGLIKKLLSAVDEAIDNIEPVSVSRGAGTCTFGVYRRQMVEGTISMLPNPDGPNDQEVTVVRFATADDRTKSLIVHFTCHTTTTGDNLVSSEFSGVAMELIEQELGEASTAMFVQGCCGDIRPALIKEGRFYSGHDEQVRDLGGQLYREVIRILGEAMLPLSNTTLATERVECPLVYTDIPTLEELQEKVQSDDPWIRRWAQLLLEHPEWLQDSIPLDLVRFDIAEGLSLLSMNAEMVIRYGLYIKEKSDRAVLPLAYTNGVLGYVPTAEQIAEGGYEAGASHIYFGLCSPFVPKLEQDIYQSIDLLLEKSTS